MVSSSAATWSEAFSYDRFGNLYKKAGTGAAAGWSWDFISQLVSAKNQVGQYWHDPNGNAYPTGGSYDIENRLLSYSMGVDTYGMAYAPDNKRVVRARTNALDELHFYVGNQRLSVCGTTVVSGQAVYNGCTEELYFAGRRLQSTDRLGSKANAKLLPYGEEITSPPTDNNGQKFATYFRDAGGLDYADQRYYTAVMGRFMTADPYIASAGVSDPSSWNRYMYTRGNPINRTDRYGLEDEGPEQTYCDLHPILCRSFPPFLDLQEPTGGQDPEAIETQLYPGLNSMGGAAFAMMRLTDTCAKFLGASSGQAGREIFFALLAKGTREDLGFTSLVIEADERVTYGYLTARLRNGQIVVNSNSRLNNLRNVYLGTGEITGRTYSRDILADFASQFGLVDTGLGLNYTYAAVYLLHELGHFTTVLLNTTMTIKVYLPPTPNLLSTIASPVRR